VSREEILIVDDDPNLREAGDGRAALAAVAARPPSLVLLDVLMPELDGIETCRQLRATTQLPIVFLSSRGEELDRVLGLELGGDDYITKPFSPRELVSRVKAVLRRAQRLVTSPSADLVEAAQIRLDGAQHRVWATNTSPHTELTFTATEFRLLRVLMLQPGRVYSRDDLMKQAYEGSHFVSGRTLDSHMRRIRHKLRDVGLAPIETVHGVGYRLQRG